MTRTQHKRKITTGAPTPADVLRGEIVLNQVDRLAYSKDENDQIWQIGGTGGGSGNTGQATVDFGADDNDLATVTVAAPWVAASSKIICSPAYEATPEHDPEDVLLEQITVAPGNIVPGVSFDLMAFAPESTFGTYKINWQGA